MVAERKVIDIEDVSEVAALTRELDEHPEGLILRRDGRQIAVLSTLSDASAVHGEAGPRWKTMTPKERETFRSLAGAWAGTVDFKALDAEREESRRFNIEQAEKRHGERWGAEG
jgi:hypothetical protein